MVKKMNARTKSMVNRLDQIVAELDIVIGDMKHIGYDDFERELGKAKDDVDQVSHIIKVRNHVCLNCNGEGYDIADSPCDECDGEGYVLVR